MLDDVQSAVLADHQAPCIRQRLAAVERSGRLHLLDQLASTHGCRVEVLVPLQQVADARVDSAGAGAFVRWRVEPIAID